MAFPLSADCRLYETRGVAQLGRVIVGRDAVKAAITVLTPHPLAASHRNSRFFQITNDPLSCLKVACHLALPGDVLLVNQLGPTSDSSEALLQVAILSLTTTDGDMIRPFESRIIRLAPITDL